MTTSSVGVSILLCLLLYVDDARQHKNIGFVHESQISLSKKEMKDLGSKKWLWAMNQELAARLTELRVRDQKLDK